MIVLTDTGGKRHHLALGAIASFSEASTSSQWHGIRAIVYLFDRRVLEVQDTAPEIAAMIEKEQQR